MKMQKIGIHSLSNIKTAINNPRSAIVEFNRIYNQGFEFRSSPSINKDGVDVVSEDWDYLIILDACRFDTFNKLSENLPGKLSKKESKASTTIEFLLTNFLNKDLHDTIYLTSNPQLYRTETGLNRLGDYTFEQDRVNVSFYRQIDLWRDNWNNKYGTVMPEVVTDKALSVNKEHPDKRLIIHFLQPHAPFVGKTGRREFPTNKLNFWEPFRNGEFDISVETAKQAYRENLELVLPHVSKLLSELEGKTVVTADHGELLGERDYPIPIRRFGHPSVTNLSPLIEVPWLVNKRGSRPNITSQAPESVNNSIVDSGVVEDRLRDLGYTE